ncbi:GroES-like protein [Irpex lacteus]|nr:GroES-like protein [Irpex lacteus]
MPTHKALLLLQEQGEYAVQDVSTPKPGPGEILVEVRAAGLNPSDWKRRDFGVLISEYPAILGADIAGIVKEIGEGVTNFTAGDRVIHEGFFENSKAAFQQYSIVPAEIVAKLPPNLSFEEGATIPVALTAAAFGLYGGITTTGELRGAELAPVWEANGRGKYSGQPIVVIGGSSAVGQQVIQLAKLSGFNPIIATASLKNTELLKSLGATHVIDRHADLVTSVSNITSESIKFVYDTIGNKQAAEPAYTILASGGTFINLNAPSPIDEAKQDSTKRVANVFGIAHDPSQHAVAVSVWANVTKLLEAGDIKPNIVEIVPNGLSGIPESLERIKANKISGKKLVAQPWA